MATPTLLSDHYFCLLSCWAQCRYNISECALKSIRGQSRNQRCCKRKRLQSWPNQHWGGWNSCPGHRKQPLQVRSAGWTDGLLMSQGVRVRNGLGLLFWSTLDCSGDCHLYDNCYSVNLQRLHGKRKGLWGVELADALLWSFILSPLRQMSSYKSPLSSFPPFRNAFGSIDVWAAPSSPDCIWTKAVCVCKTGQSFCSMESYIHVLLAMLRSSFPGAATTSWFAAQQHTYLWPTGHEEHAPREHSHSAPSSCSTAPGCWAGCRSPGHLPLTASPSGSNGRYPSAAPFQRADTWWGVVVQDSLIFHIAV